MQEYAKESKECADVRRYARRHGSYNDIRGYACEVSGRCNGQGHENAGEGTRGHAKIDEDVRGNVRACGGIRRYLYGKVYDSTQRYTKTYVGARGCKDTCEVM